MEWTLFAIFDIESNDREIKQHEYPNYTELLVAYGRYNDVQSYGGGTVLLECSDDKVCFLPLYADTGVDHNVVYIHNCSAGHLIRVQNFYNSYQSKTKFKIYGR